MPRDYDANRNSEPFIPAIGEAAENSNAVRHERCMVESSGQIGLWCGREKGHDGAHSVAILDSDRVYVWPNE